MNLAEAHDSDSAVGFHPTAIAGLDEAKREVPVQSVVAQTGVFIPDEPINVPESDRDVGFHPAAIAGLSVSAATMPIDQRLQQQLDEWDEFVTDDPEEGVLTSRLARAVVTRIANEVEFQGLRRQVITVEAQGDEDGGVLLVFDNLTLRRRILFEIPAFPSSVCLKVVGNDDMAKAWLKRDFHVRDLSADFRWLTDE